MPPLNKNCLVLFCTIWGYQILGEENSNEKPWEDQVLEDVMESTTTGTKIPKSNNSASKLGAEAYCQHIYAWKKYFLSKLIVQHTVIHAQKFWKLWKSKTDLELWKL